MKNTREQMIEKLVELVGENHHYVKAFKNISKSYCEDKDFYISNGFSEDKIQDMLNSVYEYYLDKAENFPKFEEITKYQVYEYGCGYNSTGMIFDTKELAEKYVKEVLGWVNERSYGISKVKYFKEKA